MSCIIDLMLEPNHDTTAEIHQSIRGTVKIRIERGNETINLYLASVHHAAEIIAELTKSLKQIKSRIDEDAAYEAERDRRAGL